MGEDKLDINYDYQSNYIEQEQFVTKAEYDKLVSYVEDIAKKMNVVYNEVKNSKTIKINKLNEIFDIKE